MQKIEDIMDFRQNLERIFMFIHVIFFCIRRLGLHLT